MLPRALQAVASASAKCQQQQLARVCIWEHLGPLSRFEGNISIGSAGGQLGRMGGSMECTTYCESAHTVTSNALFSSFEARRGVKTSATEEQKEAPAPFTTSADAPLAPSKPPGGVKAPEMPRLPQGFNAATAWMSQLKEKGEAAKTTLSNFVSKQQKLTKQAGEKQRALTLHLEAAWQNHDGAILAGAGVASSLVLWRMFHNMGSVFFDLGGFTSNLEVLLLASGVTSIMGIYLRRMYTVDPDEIVKIAMRNLQTSPGVLEVLGAPLTKKRTYACTVTGGGARFSGWVPRIVSRRVHVMFYVKGAERTGLVAVRARKRQGGYHFNLLSVDCPAEKEGHHRIFLAGNSASYARAGIVEVLKHPLDHLTDATSELDREDEAFEKIQKAEKQPKALDKGGGMYPWERAYLGGTAGFFSSAKGAFGSIFNFKLPSLPKLPKF
eukprot:CAMPEP_0198210400 /NCGR_PEP_ID=MMETSP1445-20131203/20084_1 /TAXON_ID=36898 /ORGANISM="Pyramimonas sp., Strain CCMP2087" /LENGTH=438 /DNA_ID=CAMNT_0043884457 /DNA_START=132 /DNA_END=1448 /DNA_ORIENTATION=+